MNHQSNPRSIDRGSLASYIIGFIFSIYLTITAYLLVIDHAFTSRPLMYLLAGLALAQFLVQILFFLHLGREAKPRWKLAVFIFMLVVVIIIVLGSIWIMTNLNYHMTPAEINAYMNSQDGL